MKMRFLLLILLFIFPLFAYGEIKTITKTERVVVPTNQSVEQVKEYVGEKLFRQAAEEAGVAISSSTTLVDGKISKDEIKMQTSAIAKKDTKILKQEIDNGQTYITVEVKATVDSGELDEFLRRLVQNEELKQQLSLERKKNLELEKKLANASKEEYDQSLSKEAEELAKIRAARQKQLEIDISNAKKLLIEAERRQKEEELKAAQDLERIKQEYLARDTALKAKIAAEKDAQAKAEMEYHVLLEELTQNTLLNDKSMDMKFNGTVEEIALDASQVRVNFASIIKEYNVLISANLKQMEAYHKSQLQVLEAQAFTEEPPTKGEWDDNATYNERLSDYEQRKIDFQNKKAQDIANLKEEYNNKVNESIETSKQSLLNALKPLYERLKKYNRGDYISSDVSQAVISFGERDLDGRTLPITIRYKKKTYDFIYQFDSLEEFRLMYETRASFKADAIYALAPKGEKGAKPYLKGFLVTHLGNNKEKFFEINEDYEIFPEIILYENMLNELFPSDFSYTNDNVSPNTQNNVIIVNKSYQSDMQKNNVDEDYRKFYFSVGLSGAIAFDGEAGGGDVSVQFHWRFNRWIGMYANASFLGSGELDDDDDRENDFGLAGGVGLDVYITNNILLFGEANLGYFTGNGYDYDDRYYGETGGLIKGGVAYQASFRQSSATAFRLTLFVEKVFSETISGDSAFIGAGVHLCF